MLDSTLELPGGQLLTLKSYFVALKVAYTLLFLLFAAAVASSKRVTALLPIGALVLFAAAWAAFVWPLNRPYALLDHHPSLLDLAGPMVSAARQQPTEGWMAGQPNGTPFSSLLLAVVSGFDPGRLLKLYPWVPPAMTVLFALVALSRFRFDQQKIGWS